MPVMQHGECEVSALLLIPHNGWWLIHASAIWAILAGPPIYEGTTVPPAISRPANVTATSSSPGVEMQCYGKDGSVVLLVGNLEEKHDVHGEQKPLFRVSDPWLRCLVKLPDGNPFTMLVDQ